MRAMASPRDERAPHTELRPSTRPVADVQAAFERLTRRQALQTLVRGALPVAETQRLLGPALGPRDAALPDEAWAGLVAAIAVQSAEFRQVLAQRLDDHLAWDQAPATLDDWWPVVRERPLEALWMAALSRDRAVRREFKHIAEHCLENYRNSPACKPPTWAFIDALLHIHGVQGQRLSEAEHAVAEGLRRIEAERERLDELREELRKLRRENAELRAERARLERQQRASAPSTGGPTANTPASAPPELVALLERRVRKLEKERAHLVRLLEREAAEPAEVVHGATVAETASRAASAPASAPDAALARPANDPNPRQRVLRMMLRKLLVKGKIGASHTHEDNVYRGLADHEKGLAKQVMELLYREGLLLPKPTLTDPHVSLEPERLAEIHALVAGRIDNPRLRRFVEE